ncbi:hypothetical protein ACJX0J_006625, partial [Zea mays]
HSTFNCLFILDFHQLHLLLQLGLVGSVVVMILRVDDQQGASREALEICRLGEGSAQFMGIHFLKNASYILMRDFERATSR